MKGDITIEVGFAADWEEYADAWKESMKHYYWYRENPVFDYNKDEELAVMKSDFGRPGNLFLEARELVDNQIVGVLGLRYSDMMARIRRWEPCIIPEFQNSHCSKALLEKAFEHLISIGVKRIGCLLKYPLGSPEVADKLITLYHDAGFVSSRPDSIDLVMSLETTYNSSSEAGVTIETGENYTFEDLASITVKSFTSTDEERAIHGFDKTVTEHIQSTALLQRMAEGFYGHSPDEFRKIAVVEGVPVGFLSGFVIKSDFKPLTGVLGPLAVLPEYRRQGIAMTLISELLLTLEGYGCEFAAVGTPAANDGAIKLYKKAGFDLACRLVTLDKQL